MSADRRARRLAEPNDPSYELLFSEHGDVDEVVIRLLLGLHADLWGTAEVLELRSGSERDTSRVEPNDISRQDHLLATVISLGRALLIYRRLLRSVARRARLQFALTTLFGALAALMALVAAFGRDGFEIVGAAAAVATLGYSAFKAYRHSS